MDKPTTPELSPEDINKIQQILEKSKTQDKLREIQKEIVKLLKREPSISKYWSTFREREEVKSIGSVIEKINDHRREGETSYNEVCVKDYIGTQIICAYPDDIIKILDWIYSAQGGQEVFDIVTTREQAEKEQTTRENRTGYRAYHICLKLKKNVVHKLPAGYEEEQFELQIKTALDAGWDFKTHDVTYKASNNDPELLKHMQLISNSLNSIDWQTLLLRDQIMREQFIKAELRIAASSVLFYHHLTKEDSPIKLIDIEDIDLLTEDGVDSLEKLLEEYYSKHGIDVKYSAGIAFISLQRQDRFMQEKALSYSNDYVQRTEGNHDEYIKALRMRALLRWAFHKTRHAVDDMCYVYQTTKRPKDVNDYLYFVCELYERTPEDIKRAKECLQILESADKDEEEGNTTKFKDTIGSYYINCGKDRDELQKGLNLIREARDEARGTKIENLLERFCAYHEHIYLKNLSKIEFRY